MSDLESDINLRLMQKYYSDINKVSNNYAGLGKKICMSTTVVCLTSYNPIDQMHPCNSLVYYSTYIVTGVKFKIHTTLCCLKNQLQSTTMMYILCMIVAKNFTLL